jgi:hypothetical protein
MICFFGFLSKSFGPDQNLFVEEIQICSLGEGILLDFFHRTDPVFADGRFTAARNITRGGWFDAVVELSDGSFYRDRFYYGAEVNVSLVVVPHKAVRRLNHPWHCVCLTDNHYALNICQGCNRNYYLGMMHGLALVPLVSAPFQVSKAVLLLGEAWTTSAKLLTVYERYLHVALASCLAVLDIGFLVTWVPKVVCELIALARSGVKLTVDLIMRIIERFAERTFVYEAPKMAAEIIERLNQHNIQQVKTMHRQIMLGEMPVPEGFDPYEH